MHVTSYLPTCRSAKYCSVLFAFLSSILLLSLGGTWVLLFFQFRRISMSLRNSFVWFYPQTAQNRKNVQDETEKPVIPEIVTSLPDATPSQDTEAAPSLEETVRKKVLSPSSSASEL